jgi:tRNA (mo5U34)-methyltransferase
VTTPEELQAQADALRWYHSIDLGHGVVTKGVMVQETPAGVMPDVTGRSVLDIGAWDGKFSFAAEQAGASRVVALDHDAWGVDFVATRPDQSKDGTQSWRSDLPGQRGFNFAKAALDSKVEPVVGDFQTMDLDALGEFDVVLYLGVLDHMKEPLSCLERLRAVTKEVAVIETEAVHFEGFENEVLLRFQAGNDLRGNCDSWYVPTIEALHNLCRAAGFREVHTVIGPPPPPAPAAAAKEPSLRQKVGRRVGALTIPPPRPPNLNYRAVVHAFS